MESANAAENGDPAGLAGKAAQLRQRFDIDPASPISNLDTPSSKAFVATDRRDPDRALFALICTTDLPFRSEVASLLKGAELTGVMSPVDWGPVEWPPFNRRCMAVIYDRPEGGSLADPRIRKLAEISHHDIPKRVIAPLVKGLRAMERLGLTHRAIRSDNLFFADAARENLMLGDCITAPAGFDQPAPFEPIERTMAGRAGRGEGTARDDIHALGATVVMLVADRNPVAELGDEDLFAQRLEQGTYATLCKDIRIPVALIEPLRGMLNDNPEERWGLDALEVWLDGRRPDPPKRKRRPKADRAFAFAGREHYRPRTLADAFSRNVGDAAKVIRDGQLEQWLRRGIDASAIAKAVARITAVDGTRQQRMRDRDDLLVSEVCILLDPEAPIRYKGFSFMADGFGPAFAEWWLSRGDGQTPADVLTRGLPALWLAVQDPPDPRADLLQNRFARASAYVQREEIGFGLERCLYETNPGVPCQSAPLKQGHVHGAADLLPALDAIAGRAAPDAKPVDRHVAAFVAARLSDNIGQQLTALADPAPGRSVVGMLGLLALLQWRMRIPPVFALAAWVGGLLGPAIETYHSAATRRAIEQEIGQKVKLGTLPDLYNLVEDPVRRRSDADGFAAAVAGYAAAQSEIDAIDDGAERLLQSSHRLGRQAAATASVAISMIVIAATLLVRLI